MKLFFIALFISAALIYAWRRLSVETRATIKAIMDELSRKARDRLFRRHMSYRHMFMDEKGELNPAGKVALADLVRFCRGLNTPAQVSRFTGTVDPVATGIAIGRQEVLLHVMKQLSLDTADLFQIAKEEQAA